MDERQLVRALREGPPFATRYSGSALRDTVRFAVLAELPRMGQLQRWRRPEYRYLGLAAAALAIAVIGLYVALAGPRPGNQGPTPTSVTSGIPIGASGSVELHVGGRYQASAFSEPFGFVTPQFDPTVDQGDGVVAVAEQLGSTGGVLRIQYGCCWATWLIDDQPVSADVCDPAVDLSSGTLPDIPFTPREVASWLGSSQTLVLGDPVEIPVDGRTALRFDIRAPLAHCRVATTSGTYPLDTRVFAIPSGDDTILYVTWSDPGSRPYVERSADELVRSMTFE